MGPWLRSRTISIAGRYTYLHLAAQGEKSLAFHADEYYWCDLGRPENVILAAQDLNQKTIL
jgi:NDP-sugar pyrophosphorylase family protein